MNFLIKCLTIAIGISSPALAEPVRAGHAEVEWISGSTGFEAGKPVATAFKMVMDDGWHTYWSNPGEAGMPLSMEMDLPDGWKAEGPQHPWPIRFKTGDLSDFGYAGTVLFPIILHPPESADQDVQLEASFSWLTCDDSSCVPGEATCTLSLQANDAKATPEAKEIAAALKRVPVPADDSWKLVAVVGKDSVVLQITVPKEHDPKKFETFPLTPEVIDPGAVFDWQHEKGRWKTTVPLSEYAPSSLKALELVIDAATLDRPVKVGGPAS